MPKPAAHPTQSYHDYYPFGMEVPGRSYSAGDYRFGFNGKEADPEAVAAGSQYDYGFRIYNTAIGRFLSVDPLTASYPWYTPYQFAGNKPIWAIDLDGLEEWIVTKVYENGKVNAALKYNPGHVGEGVDYKYTMDGREVTIRKEAFVHGSWEEKASTLNLRYYRNLEDKKNDQASYGPLGANGVTIAQGKYHERSTYDIIGSVIEVSDIPNISDFFPTNGSIISQEASEKAKAIASFMLENEDIQAKILGHTSRKFSAEHNLHLSQKRAEALCKVIYNQAAVLGATTEQLTSLNQRLHPIGMGETEAETRGRMDTDDSAEDRKVEVKFTLPE